MLRPDRCEEHSHASGGGQSCCADLPLDFLFLHPHLRADHFERRFIAQHYRNVFDFKPPFLLHCANEALHLHQQSPQSLLLDLRRTQGAALLSNQHGDSR